MCCRLRALTPTFLVWSHGLWKLPFQRKCRFQMTYSEVVAPHDYFIEDAVKRVLTRHGHYTVIVLAREWFCDHSDSDWVESYWDHCQEPDRSSERMTDTHMQKHTYTQWEKERERAVFTLQQKTSTLTKVTFPPKTFNILPLEHYITLTQIYQNLTSVLCFHHRQNSLMLAVLLSHFTFQAAEKKQMRQLTANLSSALFTFTVTAARSLCWTTHSHSAHVSLSFFLACGCLLQQGDKVCLRKCCRQDKRLLAKTGELGNSASQRMTWQMTLAALILSDQ